MCLRRPTPINTGRLLSQLKGRLTNRRYTAATVFVDHFSHLRYIHLMTAMTSQETIEAKVAFERFAREKWHSTNQTLSCRQRPLC